MHKPDINEFTSALRNLFNNPAVKDAEHQVQQLLQAQISKMGMVSREEFEAQKAVLERTRLRLQSLEQAFDSLTQ